MIEALWYAAQAFFADIVRGGKLQWLFPGKLNLVRKPICMLWLSGLIITTLAPTWWSSVFVIWFGLIGWRAGTGDPMGKAATSHATVKELIADYYSNMEWWQWTDNAWWSLVTLGLIWTWPAIPIAIITQDFNWLYVPLLYMFSFPFASILTKKIFTDPDERWQGAEGVRSFIFMFLFKAGLG